jgi:hypothetical protein
MVLIAELVAIAWALFAVIAVIVYLTTRRGRSKGEDPAQRG